MLGFGWCKTLSAKGTLQVYNHRLSEQRAQQPAGVLQHGVEQARLLAHGYEDSIPVRDNKTDEGRALNRRVVMVAIP